MFEIFRAELAPTEISPPSKDNAGDAVEELAPEEVF